MRIVPPKPPRLVWNRSYQVSFDYWRSLARQYTIERENSRPWQLGCDGFPLSRFCPEVLRGNRGFVGLYHYRSSGADSGLATIRFGGTLFLRTSGSALPGDFVKSLLVPPRLIDYLTNDGRAETPGGESLSQFFSRQISEGSLFLH